MRALSLGGSRRGSSTVTHPCLGRGFLLALLARSLTTDARFGEILESLGGFRAGWSLGTIRRHGPGEVLAMGSCWDVPPTLGQSSPAPARSPAPPPPPLPRPPAPSPPRPGVAPLLVPRCFRPCVAWAGGWPLVGVLGCGPPPRFSPPPLTCSHMHCCLSGRSRSALACCR